MSSKNFSRLILVLVVILIAFYIVKRITSPKKFQKEAVFLGVEDYGALTKGENLDHSLISKFKFKFYIDGEEKTFSIDNGKEVKEGVYTFEIQNKLQEGYIYDVVIEKNTIKSVKLLDEDKKAMLSGRVNNIEQDSFIEVGEEKITLTKDTGIYKITWKAGNSSVEKVEINDLKDKTVKVTLDKDGKAKNIYVTFISEKYTSPVKAIPGEKTLKNFLTTALEPVGTALYIYGGSWDWQDEGSSLQATTIGIPQSWIDFYQYQNADYTYREKDGNEEIKNPSNSYYPYGEWNQYCYAGVDCSGYVGWVIYNTLNTESGKEGYVMGATKMAKTFAENTWGTWTQEVKIPTNREESDFKVGDIFSMNGHVWICFGTCDDGSIVITHSTPSDSINGQPGGGIQISAIGPSEDCEAYQLAKKYMEKYYPDWSKRYKTILKKPEDYIKFKKESAAGKFSWDLENGILKDPDNYRDKKPGEILKDIFGEK